MIALAPSVVLDSQLHEQLVFLLRQALLTFNLGHWNGFMEAALHEDFPHITVCLFVC